VSPVTATRRFGLLLSLIAIGGCASESTVTGRALATDETFTGTASEGGTFSSGSLSLSSSKGTKCTGRTMGSESIGSTVAVITCDDGRAGSVVFLDAQDQSVGTGVIGNDQVTLTIAK